jgi:enoyl-CoA hydratase
MTDDDILLMELADRVAVVTLNRPERRNTLTRALMQRIGEVFPELDADDRVDVVILTGTDPAFCAGVDLKEAATGAGLLSDPVNITERGLLPAMAKPVIAAVNGPATTGGLELALSCDFLIASDRARFADTHTRVGVMPGGGVTVRLARAIGIQRAKELSITGNFLDAETARQWGLVNHVVPHEELLAFCRRLAADVVSNDQRGVRQILDLYDLGMATTEDEAWDLEQRVARAWASGGVDPAEIERRRALIVTRGREQLAGQG